MIKMIINNTNIYYFKWITYKIWQTYEEVYTCRWDEEEQLARRSCHHWHDGSQTDTFIATTGSTWHIGTWADAFVAQYIVMSTWALSISFPGTQLNCSLYSSSLYSSSLKPGWTRLLLLNVDAWLENSAGPPLAAQVHLRHLPVATALSAHMRAAGTRLW